MLVDVRLLHRSLAFQENAFQQGFKESLSAAVTQPDGNESGKNMAVMLREMNEEKRGTSETFLSFLHVLMRCFLLSFFLDYI